MFSKRPERPQSHYQVILSNLEKESQVNARRYFAALAIIVAGGMVLGMWSPLARDGNALRGQVAPSSSKFQVDPFWPKPLPDDWVTGNVGGACADKNDHIFIVNRTADPTNLTEQEKIAARPAPVFIEFDADGKVVNSWGDTKIVPGGIHACYFDPDGNFWVGGNTDAIAQKYSHDGKLLLQIGTKGKFDTDRKSTRLNSSHIQKSRMPSSA